MSNGRQPCLRRLQGMPGFEEIEAQVQTFLVCRHLETVCCWAQMRSPSILVAVGNIPKQDLIQDLKMPISMKLSAGMQCIFIPARFRSVVSELFVHDFLWCS